MANVEAFRSHLPKRGGADSMPSRDFGVFFTLSNEVKNTTDMPGSSPGAADAEMGPIVVVVLGMARRYDSTIA